MNLTISSTSCNTSSLNATANQTTASGDDNAAIYILVVISIYVLSLAFFFIKSLQTKPTDENQLHSYLDEVAQRELSARQIMVKSMRERLHMSESNSNQRIEEMNSNALIKEEEISLIV
ncbi:hypothetical protein EB796_024021 [Bugula neritina]|uniref:Uncharacterized protein n=1 Tax=Bugula neritina TaxID=10212 RepID=A0A7J7IW76_BUGNE|nr:hypothetical protein EB796_024021 [Bugula neritina]